MIEILELATLIGMALGAMALLKLIEKI